mgnify:CR=1 FL=1
MEQKDLLPPKLAHLFLCWFLKDELLEEVEGDLLEKYEQQLSNSSSTRAKLNYWYQVIHYIRPFAIRNNWLSQLMSFAMFQNYLKVAWRNLLRYKLYTGIKIGGFALGIAACLLIALFIQDELRYDQHYSEVDRTYRLINRDDSQGEIMQWTAFQAPIATVLQADFPEVEAVARLIPYDWYNAGNNQFRPADRKENNHEKSFAYADPALLEILDIEMIYGDRQEALSQPNTIVLSQKMAEKYFPGQDPVGETIFLNEELENPYKVNGVMEDFKPNMHLQHEFLITLKEVEFWPGEQASWCCSNYNTYLRLRPDTDLIHFEEKLLSIRDNYMVPFFRKQGNQGADEMAKHHSFLMQPIADIHLHSSGIHDFYKHGDIKVVWLFGAIALLILLLAVINFINLSTAKSANRAKEVGLRKVVGSFRSNLIRQFLVESILFSFLAFVLGVTLGYLALPIFNDIAGKALQIPWGDWQFYPVLLGSLLLTGLLAGFYPSLYLSGFRPIEVLKGSLSRGSKNSQLQGSLVVFQFGISVVLIIGAFIISRQMDFILNKDLGYEKDQVLVLHGTNTLEGRLPAFKEQLLQLSAVESATASNYLPVSDAKRDQNEFWREGKEQEDIGKGAQFWAVDEDYINTLGINILEGRNFSPEIASDSSAMIINESMVKRMGLENPLGQRLTNGFSPPYTVIGVMEDFHFESMKGRITPLSLSLGGGAPATLAVKITTGDVTAIIQEMTKVWDSFLPNQAIRYTFLDERFANMYEEVQRIGNIFTGFSVLAIIIACLGLFALSAFMVEQRRKEVSVRKVLGASISNLFQLLTSHFLRLILIAFVIAMPVGWYAMKTWLQDFTYRVPITWDVFVIAGGIILLIALLTISSEALKAALGNPIKHLRSE